MVRLPPAMHSYGRTSFINPRAFRWRHSAPLGVLWIALLLIAPPASAQEEAARVVPRGALRVTFAPHYFNYDRRFSPTGSVELLGTDLSGDSVGATMLPTLIPAQSALRSITGDSTLRVNLGAWRTTLDADIRRFPLGLAIGLTSWMTLSVNLPIVTTRMNVAMQIDSGSSTWGWNQGLAESGSTTGLSDITALLDQIEASATSLEALIAGGSFGCPSGAQCDQARALVARTRAIRDALVTLTGVIPTGGSPLALPAPPFAPMADSPAGLALLQTLASLQAELAAFGATAVTATMPLPADPLDTAAVRTVITSPDLGYNADPLVASRPRKMTSLGDAEVGLRLGLVQSPAFRAVLAGTVRFPTGKRDSPRNFVDLGTGDRQMDVEVGLEVALEPGPWLGLSLFGSYTLQLADELPLRVTSPHRPIALAESERTVGRDLGDIIQLRAYPTIRLNESFRVFGSVSYVRKEADVYTSLGGAAPLFATFSELGTDSRVEVWSFGGGIAYRAAGGRRGPRLPIEAGLSTQTTFFGSGGLTPKGTTLGLYLRLFYRIFGAPPEAPPVE